MKKIALMLFIVSGSNFLQANSNVYKKYDEKLLIRYIQSSGTTDEPVIQLQALGGAMASYNALQNTKQILDQNNIIIEQNALIISLLKGAK